MDPGKLNHPDGKMTFVKTTTTKVAGGGQSESQNNVCTRSIALRPKKTTDVDEARQVAADVTHDLLCRYDTQTKTIRGPDHHGVLGTRTFEIVGTPIDIEERHEFLQFQVKERVL